MSVCGRVVGWNVCVDLTRTWAHRWDRRGAQPGRWVWLPRQQRPLPPPQVCSAVFPPNHNLHQIGFPSQAEPEKRKEILLPREPRWESAVPAVGARTQPGTRKGGNALLRLPRQMLLKAKGNACNYRGSEPLSTNAGLERAYTGISFPLHLIPFPLSSEI